MKSRTTKRFRKVYQDLPSEVRQQARQAYKLFIKNPNHPSLHFKQVHAIKPIFSVRIGINYRALGVRESEFIVWFWIGSHSDYDKLISRL
jgi:hypothetical protein